MSRAIAWTVGLFLIAIVLAALLLPAVQSAREAGRVPRAENKMHQMGIALDTHHDSYTGRKSGAISLSGTSDSESVGTGEGENSAPGHDRKIIYSATIDLAVENFSDIPDKVTALVKKFDAYVANSNLSGTTGESRRGTWKIRVPVARFEDFVSAAKGLGELVNAGTASKDVSEEFYDVEARIRNKTKEEERLLKLLEERPGKLEDVIAIERELSRVREELERMQGRMRVLADLTSLTTADLTITEIHNYKPEDAPTLPTRISRAFDDSLGSLIATGANTLIVIAAAAPWLPFAAIGLGLVYALIRTARRRIRGASPAKDSP